MKKSQVIDFMKDQMRFAICNYPMNSPICNVRIIADISFSTCKKFDLSIEQLNRIVAEDHKASSKERI